MKSLGIAEKIIEDAAKRIRVYPQHVNRASNVGHPCVKFLVLSRTSWRDKVPHDPGLQLVFDEGNVHEKAVLRKLDDIGVEVIEQQRDYKWDDLQLSGHIDGKIKDDRGKLIPIEIKSTSPFAFEKFAHAEDLVGEMLKGPVYHQLYPAQLLLYMWMDNKDRGLWIFKHKVSGRIQDRVIDMDPHVDYCDRLVKKIELVNSHIGMETVPENFEEYRVCEDCGFHSVCHPDKMDDQQLEFNAELEYYLDLREELKHKMRPVEAELKEVEAEIKSRLKRYDSMVLAGKWRGTPKVVEVKERVAKGYSFTKWNWSKVEESSTN